MTGFPGVAPPNFVKDSASRKIPAQDYRDFVCVACSWEGIELSLAWHEE